MIHYALIYLNNRVASSVWSTIAFGFVKTVLSETYYNYVVKWKVNSIICYFGCWLQCGSLDVAVCCHSVLMSHKTTVLNPCLGTDGDICPVRLAYIFSTDYNKEVFICSPKEWFFCGCNWPSSQSLHFTVFLSLCLAGFYTNLLSLIQFFFHTSVPCC